MSLNLKQQNDYWQASFSAMASPCECLIATADAKLARELADIAYAEAMRIEKKYSRYLKGNIVDQINTSNGQSIKVDEETAGLLDFAEQCYQLSDGLFDITSGVLRKVWHFDGSDKLPEQAAVSDILKSVGWSQLDWQRPELQLPQGMQIDFGGIGKEYAVDRVVKLVRVHSVETHVLVNFGGDLMASGPRSNGEAWWVGIDQQGLQGETSIFQTSNNKTTQSQSPTKNTPVTAIRLSQGALATSGDARRYLLKDDIRYSHILNPITGWPVENAPSAVTVMANSCLEAGMMATMASLQGSGAREFLNAQALKFWILD